MAKQELVTSDEMILQKEEVMLPAYDEFTDKRVIREMQAVFKGFEYSPDEHYEQRYTTLESLETFVAETKTELDKLDNDFKKSTAMNNGAISAKRWHFGYVINQCLKNANYGSGTADKLCAAANISTAYLYQYRAVGANLSLKDAYVLGLYGAGWDNIRELAAVQDPDMRSALITAYISATRSMNNSLMREKARAGLKAAIEKYKNGGDQIDISNPAQLTTAMEFEQEAPEFVMCQKALLKLSKQLTAITKEKTVEESFKLFSDCFLMEDANSADEKIVEFTDQAKHVLHLLNTMEELLPQFKQEVESLSKLTLTKRE